MLNVDRERFDEHLPYEIDMLCATYSKIARVPGWVTDQVTENALIESFCIHARALFEFFHQESKNHIYTDVTYHHLGSQDRFRKVLNNQIAHLVNDLRTTDPSDKIGSEKRFDMLTAARAELEGFSRYLKLDYDGTTLPKIPVYMAAPTMPSATNAIQSTTASFDGLQHGVKTFVLSVPSSLK